MVRSIADDPKSEEVLIGFTNATTLLAIARSVLAGEQLDDGGVREERRQDLLLRDVAHAALGGLGSKD